MATQTEARVRVWECPDTGRTLIELHDLLDTARADGLDVGDLPTALGLLMRAGAEVLMRLDEHDREVVLVRLPEGVEGALRGE